MKPALYDYFDNENDGPSVFSIGFIEGNGSTNVVPDKVKMMGTLRAMDEDWRVNAHKKMIEISSNLGKSHHGWAAHLRQHFLLVQVHNGNRHLNRIYTRKGRTL